MDFLLENYLWIKWLHFLAFISWMATLFYLPRLYVYHQEHSHKKEFVEVVKIQEDKLFYFIGQPSMIVTVLTGILMIVANQALLQAGYFHLKLLCAVLLLIYHFDCLRYLKQLKNDTCNKSGKFFRAYNEVPTLIMIGIITAMIIQPF